LLDAIKADKSDGDLQLNVVRIGDLNYGEVKVQEMDEESPAPIQHSLSDSGKQLPLVDLDKILIQL
jgi:hypothetical protein